MKVVDLVDRNRCPLCTGTENSVYIPFPDIPVLQCNSCNFIFSGKVMSEQMRRSYYEEGFGSKRHLQGQIINSRINAWVLTTLLDLENIKNVLDIGTGYGFFLERLRRQFKLDVTGVELSRPEATYAKEELNLNVRNKSLKESGLLKTQYDLVTSFEVIEHINEPKGFINEMAQYVRPGGHLIIMTDNFDSRMAKSLGAGFPKWIPHSHISHFSSNTLVKTLKETKSLMFVKSVSYTPWEVLLRDKYYKFRGIKKTPTEAFDLSTTLETEMNGTYNLFKLRKLVNKTWAQLTLSERMDGDLMFILARKKAS